MQGYQGLIEALKSGCELLGWERKSKQYRDVVSVCDYLVNPNFRIAVFGPFNYGKSTLLNAMLGSRTLPIDLIPTTGAAITVKYGFNVRSRIMLVDGTEVYRSGTEVLQQFAILDGNRQMRQDVASVEVFCPHPFLETGVEFIDLPGTNDREEQDNLVKEQLLSADLVVQLLDARKLMTLGERENLRDWLLDRSIKTVIFVANFLNLLEQEEQQSVQNRLRFVAESFRAELPPGFSNLYRVDALPALRARLKGDVAAASSSGLASFEAALQNVVGILQQSRGGVRLPRVQAIALQIQLSLKHKIDPLVNEIQSFNDRQNSKLEIKQRALDLIQRGFNTSVQELRDWLTLPNLLNKYQSDAAVALAENNFKSWHNKLKKDFQDLQLAVVKWLYQAYDFFQEERPEDLLIPFPTEPTITLPPKPDNNDTWSEPGSIAVGGGIGWLIGGPVGAAVVGSISYLLNKNVQKQDDDFVKESYHQQVAKLCIAATEDYFSQFSHQGLSILATYERQAEKVICFKVSPEPPEITRKREELQQLQNGFNQLLHELAKFKISSNYHPYTAIPSSRQQERVYTPTPRNTAEKKVESPRQQVYTPPPPKAPPSPNPAELEAKFRNWELDEEIAQMKSQMGSPGSQNQQAATPPKNQGEKNKIAHAYKILELQQGASFADVKQAYRNLVKKWHPDLFVGKPELQKQAQEKMLLFNEAYKILSNIDN
ncbi:MAG TPA: dynamin family protein [Leptolyngbyaceae cyanobacterium]